MSNSAGGGSQRPTADEASRRVFDAIDARVAEITAPDYVDPARRDFTRWDWVAVVGFFVACAAGFTAWGY